VSDVRYRRAAAVALPVCLLVALTAAQVVTRDDVVVRFDGVTFALETAATTDGILNRAAAADWQPAEDDWRSSAEPWTLALPTEIPAPGEPVRLRVAVRNASGTPAAVVLSVADPDPDGPGDLFGSLHVTLSEGGTVLADGPAATVLAALPGEMAPDRAEVRVVDVALSTPVTGDDRWAAARTAVQLVVAGESR
jgi:hypothetical protein